MYTSRILKKIKDYFVWVFRNLHLVFDIALCQLFDSSTYDLQIKRHKISSIQTAVISVAYIRYYKETRVIKVEVMVVNF